MPVFLPTTLQGAEQIIQSISELKNKVPSDPLEADLLSMAEMIAEEQKPGTLMRGLGVWIKTQRLEYSANENSKSYLETNIVLNVENCQRSTHRDNDRR